MKKAKDLGASLANIAGGTRHRSEISAVSQNAAPTAYQQPGRADTAMVGAHLPVIVRDQLKRLALDQKTTSQDLVAEAMNDLFAKYKMPEVAPRIDRKKLRS